MGYGDWIFLAALLGVAALGAVLGFGKVLKFVTGGPVGVVISVILCYCFGGMILDLPFVSALLAKLASTWASVGWLNTIHLEIIIYYIVLFMLATLLRILLVRLLKGLVETDVLVMRIINKVLGAALFVVFGFLIMLSVFQVIEFIGGSVQSDFYFGLAQNANAIVRPIYDWNPMKGLTDFLI